MSHQKNIDLSIILMRHGVSQWYASSDFERVLVPEAPRAIESVIDQLHAHMPLDQLQACYVSPARRTQQTYQVMKEYLLLNSIPHQVYLDQASDLYLASASTIVDKLYTLDIDLNMQDQTASYGAMVIAHNPGLSDCIYELTKVHIQLKEAEAVLLRCTVPDLTTVSSTHWDLIAYFKP